MTVQPIAAMAAPICSASTQRGSGGERRADPLTATVSAHVAVPGSTARAACASGPGLSRSAGDELVATHALLSGQRDDGAAQDAFGVLAARIDRQGAADPGLAA